MKDNCDNDELSSVPSSDISKTNSEPSSFESKIISNKNMSGVTLSFLKPTERAKLFLLKKDENIKKKLSEVEYIRKDKLYADYLHCLSYDHKTLKRITIEVNYFNLPTFINTQSCPYSFVSINALKTIIIFYKQKL